jgi:hypothetical protein
MYLLHNFKRKKVWVQNIIKSMQIKSTLAGIISSEVPSSATALI